MSTIVNVDGNDFILLDQNQVDVIPTATRGSMLTLNSVALPQGLAPFTMETIHRSAFFESHVLLLGGAERPPKRPETGFTYPRRIV